jgi:hypothetical protein
VPMGAYEAIVDEVRHRRISRVILRPRARTPPPIAPEEEPEPLEGT